MIKKILKLFICDLYKNWRKYLKIWFEFIVIAIIIDLTWQGLELLIEGGITSSAVDTIIASILMFSIFFNYEIFKIIYKIKKKNK